MREREVGASEGPGTMRKVAAHAGVSVATVSRVVNGNYPVSASTRTRVERSLRELNYVLNDNARALSRQDRLVVLVVSTIVDPFHGYIARGVQTEARAQGRVCLVLSTDGDPDGEDGAIDLAIGRRAELLVLVGGVVVDDAYGQAVSRQAQRLEEHGVTLVHCARPTPAGEVASVHFDNESGAYALTDLLLRQGHRRVLFLGGPPGLSNVMARLDGYRRAHRDRGLEVEDQLLRLGSFGREWAKLELEAVLDEGIDMTAVVASNDISAAGAYAALKARGLRIPDDVSVVGYDDVPVALDLDPPLTTIKVPLEALGREAVRVGLARRAGASGDPFETDPSQSRLGVYVVSRGSVGPAPS